MRAGRSGIDAAVIIAPCRRDSQRRDRFAPFLRTITARAGTNSQAPVGGTKHRSIITSEEKKFPQSFPCVLTK